MRPIWAQAPDYSGDMAAAKSFMSGFATSAVPDVQRQMFGNVDLSNVAKLGISGASVQSHNTANTTAINECVAAAKNNFPGYTDQQKLTCHAIITAANITYTPNPYLDATDPQNLRATGTTSNLLTVQKQQIQAARSGAITSPTNFSTSSTSCTPTTTVVPAVTRLDYCRAEKAVTASTCNTTISATVTYGTVTTSEDLTGCASQMTNPSCVAGGSSCLQTTDVDTGTKDSSGNPIIQQVCTLKSYGYDCWDVGGPWDYTQCNNLDLTCARTGKTTPTQLVSGNPVWEDVEYSCVMTPATAQSTSGCQTSICVGGTCFDATPQASTDFGQAAVGMEILRESGVYANGVDQNNLHIFTGIANGCTRPTGPGIGSNCCQASGGALKTNRDILPSIAWQAVGSAVIATGQYGRQQASNYMYDFMFHSGNDWMIEKAFEAMSSGAWDRSAGFNMSLSTYGFSIEIGGAASGSVGSVINSAANTFLPNGASDVVKELSSIYSDATMTTTTTFAGTELTFSFNPYAMAAMVAIQVIAGLFTCTQDEHMLSARRGGDLCMKLGEGCSKRLPWPLKTCIQVTETWCCWNSQLAKIIAEQGGAQLGGGARCGGFTPQELAQIDFSKINFSGLISQMVKNASTPDAIYNASTVAQASNRARQGQSAITPTGVGSAVSSPALQSYVQGLIQGMQAK